MLPFTHRVFRDKKGSKRYTRRVPTHVMCAAAGAVSEKTTKSVCYWSAYFWASEKHHARQTQEWITSHELDQINRVWDPVIMGTSQSAARHMLRAQPVGYGFTMWCVLCKHWRNRHMGSRKVRQHRACILAKPLEEWPAGQGGSLGCRCSGVGEHAPRLDDGEQLAQDNSRGNQP